MEQDIDYKGYKIKIRQCEYYESPNDWENPDMFLVYQHRDFTVKKDGFNPETIYHWAYAKNMVDSNDDPNGNYQEEMDSYPELNYYWIFPVEAYIHSGISLSLFTGRKTCQWDSSVTGYILIRRDILKDSSVNEEDLTLEEATKYGEGLIKTWNQYLSGEIYGFIVEKPETIYSISKEGYNSCMTADDYNNDIIPCDNFMKLCNTTINFDTVDSCWGYYGSPEKSGCIDEAKDIIDDLIKRNG